MTEEAKHYMVTHKGAAKQFLALVGDENGTIRNQLNEILNKGEEGFYYLATHYYSAKFDIKEFSQVTDVAKEFEVNKTPMPCLFVVYKSLKHLEEAKGVADFIKADVRIIIIENSDNCPESDQVQDFAARNEFEVVFLQPTDEQRAEAEEYAEKLGIDRLSETLDLCNWPWRISGILANKATASILGGLVDFSETKMEDDAVISDGSGPGTITALLLKGYKKYLNEHQELKPGIPPPQRGELVHLSSSPPSDIDPNTEPNTDSCTNPADVSISVDIALRKSKDGVDESQQPSTGSSQRDSDESHIVTEHEMSSEDSPTKNETGPSEHDDSPKKNETELSEQESPSKKEADSSDQDDPKKKETDSSSPTK